MAVEEHPVGVYLFADGEPVAEMWVALVEVLWPEGVEFAPVGAPAGGFEDVFEHGEVFSVVFAVEAVNRDVDGVAAVSG